MQCAEVPDNSEARVCLLCPESVMKAHYQQWEPFSRFVAAGEERMEERLSCRKRAEPSLNFLNLGQGTYIPTTPNSL